MKFNRVTESSAKGLYRDALDMVRSQLSLFMSGPKMYEDWWRRI